MTLTLFCLLSLVISILILVSTTVLSVVLHKRDMAKGNVIRKGIVIKPFQVFLIGFFIAAAVVFYPVYYTEFFVEDFGFVKVFKSILLSIHNVLRLFVLDGEFDNISSFLSNSAGVSSNVGVIYSVYAALIYIAAPTLTAGVVLSFFKGASAFIKYSLYLHSDIYILSELNEKSIILAQDILNNKTDKRRKLVVFTNVFEKEEEDNSELVSQAKRLGAICLRKDILEVGLKRSNNIFRKIYLISDDEDKNIQQALALIEKCRNTAHYNTDKTQIYAFANSVESEVLLNSIDNGAVKVRGINENRNLIIHTLNNYSIFKDARQVNDKKEISIAIVGLGAYGVELLKAVCWCGQMPGYNITIHAFDKDFNGSAKIKSIAPELIEYNGKEMIGEPYYKIVFHDNIDVRSYEFQEALSKTDFISSAFVTLGDDELNIETAMRMRVQFGRDAISAGKHIPSIFAVVYSMSKTQAASNGGLKNMQDENYGVSLIGCVKTRYSIASIEQSELETEGLNCHLYWVTHVDEADAIEKYNKYEYYRRSSIAEAIYLRFREKLISDCEPEILKEYEHKRWSAYMRSEGYIGLGEQKDYLAKTHPLLVPYQNLSAKEQNKDAIKTNEG